MANATFRQVQQANNITILADTDIIPGVQSPYGVGDDGGFTGATIKEAIRDVVAAFLVEGADISITHDDPGDTLTIAFDGAVYTDADAQDAVGSIVNSTLVYVSNTSLGRAAITGDITISAGSNASTIAANAVSNTKFRQSAGLSVVGRSTNSTGDVADITAGSDGQVLRRSGTSVGFGTLASTAFANTTIVAARLSASTTDIVFGRSTAGAGAGEEIPCTASGRALMAAASVAAQQAILGVSEVLSANRTYFVRTDGSDSNTGLVDSAGGAFLTIAKAISTCYSIVIPSGITVTIKVGGSQTGVRNFTEQATFDGPWRGGGTVVLEGDTTTPTNRTITSAPLCVTTKNGARINVAGLAFIQGASGQNALFAQNGSFLTVTGAVSFGAFPNGRHMWSADGSLLDVRVNYTITGGAAYHADATKGYLNVLGNTITLTGTPAFSSAFVISTTVAAALFAANTFSGAATGIRYSVTKNAVLDTFGGGATYLPGNAAGSAATGGQYL